MFILESCLFNIYSVFVRYWCRPCRGAKDSGFVGDGGIWSARLGSLLFIYLDAVVGEALWLRAIIFMEENMEWKMTDEHMTLYCVASSGFRPASFWLTPTSLHTAERRNQLPSSLKKSIAYSRTKSIYWFQVSRECFFLLDLSVIELWFYLSTFFRQDPIWTNVRRRLTYIFTAAKLKAMQEFTTGKSEDVVKRIKQYNSEEPIELRVCYARAAKWFSLHWQFVP